MDCPQRFSDMEIVRKLVCQYVRKPVRLPVSQQSAPRDNFLRASVIYYTCTMYVHVLQYHSTRVKHIQFIH